MYISLNKNTNTPMTKQLYSVLKNKIIQGDLKPNERLPSTRVLSKELGVSRNLVLNAYDQLLAEGYLYSKNRSGMYITEGISFYKQPFSTSINSHSVIGLQFESFSQLIDFRTGVPSLPLFPKNKWGKLYREICIDLPSNHLDYYEPRGCYELRYQLKTYLMRVRGVECNTEQILVTSGAAQSFSLLIKHFSKINPDVIAEDPMSNGITKILNSYDMNITPVPTDIEGLVTDKLPSDIDPGLIFTTPSHQYPTGAVLPINRRKTLIDYAVKHRSYIVEDDYDSEFRYEGYPIQSMQSLASSNIIYVGTFSKILFPALRIGYMIHFFA